MNEYRKILEEGLQLASTDKLDQAVLKLKRGAQDAVREDDPKWVILLAKNAGLLSEKQGRLDRAKTCYRLALKYSNSDPYLHYSLADICQKLGQVVAARRHLVACQRLAVEQNEKDLLEILKRTSKL